ncbi:Conserved_hypothetical protein [Hexamita inflata]|uniref:Uncharacterized protein n=1 Tax=Hexamita inflata TaxID=28002 RepID=A0AA86R1Y6_9EUKA|nr:Conserved hypothetical protein [Hexamita inflata]
MSGTHLRIPMLRKLEHEQLEEFIRRDSTNVLSQSVMQSQSVRSTSKVTQRVNQLVKSELIPKVTKYLGADPILQISYHVTPRIIKPEKYSFRRTASELRDAPRSSQLKCVKILDEGAFTPEHDNFLSSTLPSLDQIASYTDTNQVICSKPSHVKRLNIARDIQQRLDPCAFGIGGLSFYEIYFRFMKPSKIQAVQFSPNEAPYKEVRQLASNLGREFLHFKVTEVTKQMENAPWDFFPSRLDQLWPEPFEQLLDVCKMNDAFVCEKSFSNSTLIKDKYRIEVEQWFKQIMQDMEKRFRADLDQLVLKCVTQGLICLQGNAAQTILKNYYRIIGVQIPTIINDPEEKRFKNCNMHLRRYEQTVEEDIVRYIEVLQRIMDLDYIFKNTITQEEKLVVKSQIKGTLTIQLACILNQLLEKCYLEPLLKITTQVQEEKEEEQDKKERIAAFLANFDSESFKTSETAVNIMLELKQVRLQMKNNSHQTMGEQVERSVLKFETQNGQSKLKSQLFADIINNYTTNRKFDDDHWSKLEGMGLYTKLCDEMDQKAKAKIIKTKKSYKQEQKSKFLIEPERQVMGAKVQLHYKAILPISLLCAQIAAVKAAEEKYVYLLNTDVGKIILQKFYNQIKLVIDQEQLMQSVYKMIGNIEEWEWKY